MDEWDKLMAINVKAVMLACKLFGAHMIEQGGGKIINLSSVRDDRGALGGNAGYCATKGAVKMITKQLGVELAPYKVYVNALGPIITITPMTKERIKQDSSRYERMLLNVPMGRMADVEDLVGPAVFLASSASDFITGTDPVRRRRHDGLRLISPPFGKERGNDRHRHPIDSYSGLELIELSHVWGHGVPSEPGQTDVRMVRAVKHAQHGVLAWRITTSLHTGTHMNAPIHMVQRGDDLAAVAPGPPVRQRRRARRPEEELGGRHRRRPRGRGPGREGRRHRRHRHRLAPQVLRRPRVLRRGPGPHQRRRRVAHRQEPQVRGGRHAVHRRAAGRPPWAPIAAART